MNVLEFAKKMEKDGELLYRKLEAECPDLTVAGILSKLADDEANHYIVLEDMQKGAPPVVAESRVPENVKNVIEQVNWSFSGDIVEADAFSIALDVEKKSEAFYREIAQKAKTETEKEFFLKIAGQEKDHYATVEAILNAFLNEICL
jgi:erythrin-vacuolar iron transport family protein